jgi:hypothetical protein
VRHEGRSSRASPGRKNSDLWSSAIGYNRTMASTGDVTSSSTTAYPLPSRDPEALYRAADYRKDCLLFSGILPPCLHCTDKRIETCMAGTRSCMSFTRYTAQAGRSERR